jgi:hypothetical protein
MREVQTECDDPILEIRQAVSQALQIMAIDGDHKAITDMVVDKLPEFFRNRLQIADDVFEYKPEE